MAGDPNDICARPVCNRRRSKHAAWEAFWNEHGITHTFVEPPPGPLFGAETVSELTDALVRWLQEQGLEANRVSADTTPGMAEVEERMGMEHGWDLGQGFIGVTLSNGTDVSIALGVTE